jgi:capsular polysaccharide biosynthesis protein
MTGPWRIEDAEPSRTPAGMAVEGSWVSIHYLRSCLRRRWRFVLMTTTAGLMLALAALTLVPASSSADATVFLAHDTGADPMTAIATDHKLLVNRTVAGQVVDQLHLPMTVDEFLATYSASEPSTELLDIQLKAGSPQEAVRRLTALCAAFLQFRNDQLATQARYIVTTDQSHIAALRKEVDLVNQEYTAALAHRDHPAASQALTDRSELLQQIGTLQSTIEDTQLQSESLATASHVVDPPAPVPAGGPKHMVLGVMSGLILGCGLGVGIVFAHALVSNRLRRREEIATALGQAVPFSAGPVHGRLPWYLPVHRPSVARRRRRNLEILSEGLAEALPEGRGARQRVALVGVGDLRAAASVIVETGLRLQVQGDRVFLVDLTNAGVLGRYQSDELAILRPEVRRAGSASGALSVVSSMSDVLPHGDPREEQWKRASLVLVLAEVDLGVGNRQLMTWADSAVLMVGAGKVTAEYLRSISRLFSSAGPRLEFAMVVGADRTDESLGVPRPEAREELQRRARS